MTIDNHTPSTMAQQELPAPIQGQKSRTVAILLAFFLGGLGIHKFYLGQKGWGLVYLLFFWTGIPALIGLVECIIYLFMGSERFAEKYG